MATVQPEMDNRVTQADVRATVRMAPNMCPFSMSDVPSARSTGEVCAAANRYSPRGRQIWKNSRRTRCTRAGNGPRNHVDNPTRDLDTDG